MSRGNENWIEKSGSLRNRGFEKSGFDCKLKMELGKIKHLPAVVDSSGKEEEIEIGLRSL